MSVLARAKCILDGALRRNRMEGDMDAELRFHIAKYTEDLVGSGMPREKAERQARIEFGHLQPAIFSVVNAWVLKPLPYANPDQLVVIDSADVKGKWTGVTSAGDLDDWRTQNNGVFENICGWQSSVFTLENGTSPLPAHSSAQNSFACWE